MRGVILAAIFAVAGLGGCDALFDKARWAEGAGRSDDLNNPRAAMLGSMSAAGVRPGATRAHVRELLGRPDSTSAGHDSYYLGIEPLGVDTHYMRIIYDDSDIVESIEYIHG